MTSWRDPILAHFTPDLAAVARLTIVADPDRLLTEPGVVEGVRLRGFEILAFEDAVAFRYAYEQRFRRVWDSGRSTTLVVALRAPRTDLDALPYDLIEEAKRESRLFSFSLAELFPNLQPHVVSDLDRSNLDAVYAAQEHHRPPPLGVNATRDFLLRHVFEVTPELIRTPADLLRLLLRRHYRGRPFSPALDDHLIRSLADDARWNAWPLGQIVPSRTNFLAYLQERWPLFVSRGRTPSETAVGEPPAPYGLRYPGPTDLPFDHDDVRVYIDNLFVDGLLTPTNAVSKESVKGTWMTVGVAGDEHGDNVERLRRLLGVLEQEFPPGEADHRQWLQMAQRWGDAVALRCAAAGPLGAELDGTFEAMHARIEHNFATWLDSHYAALCNLAPWPRPVMVHHVSRFMAHDMTGPERAKRALVVVDGLSLDQWAAIRQALPARAWSVEDGAVFAWIPTLTSVSRQAIFAAEAPFFFAPSIATTQKEEKHWSRFWEDRGLRGNEVAYVCQRDSEDDDALIARVRQSAEEPMCKALAVVIGTIDRMLHGAVTGTDGMHASARHWARRAALAKLVNVLVEGGFEVALTADHGNVEAHGIGKPDVGVTAEERGERVHVFRDEPTRKKIESRYAGSIAWPTIGLPEDYLPLIAPARRAFISEGKRTVAHGGVCIEEVIVPFVRITKT